MLFRSASPGRGRPGEGPGGLPGDAGREAAEGAALGKALTQSGRSGPSVATDPRRLVQGRSGGGSAVRVRADTPPCRPPPRSLSSVVSENGLGPSALARGPAAGSSQDTPTLYTHTDTHTHTCRCPQPLVSSRDTPTHTHTHT